MTKLYLSTIDSDVDDEVKISEREEFRLLDKDLKVDLMFSGGACFRTTYKRNATTPFMVNE